MSEKEYIKAGKSIAEPNDDDAPQLINDTTPRLVSINSKLYLLLVLSLFVVMAQSFWINSANQRAETNTELMYIKMYPNGTWDVEYRNTGNEADFFPLTIEKLLNDYVIARYGVNPHEIRRDYGYSVLFMAQPLAASFVGGGLGQYNAALKAQEAMAAGKYEEVSVRFIDHFDVSNGVFVHGNSDVYRTNIFIERIIKNSAGIVQGEPVKEVATLHWRIKSVKELSKFNRDQLRANPIGLEIIKESKELDRSSQVSSSY